MRLEDSEFAGFDIQNYVPGANLELKIEGLVLFYEHGGRLMMKFPRDTTHEPKIEIKQKNVSPAIPRIIPIPAGVQATISHTDATSIMRIDPRDVLNIRTLHPGVALDPTVLTSPSSTNSSSLLLSNAIISPAVGQDNRPILTTFQFWEVSFDDSSPRQPIAKVRRFNLERRVYPRGIAAAMMGGVLNKPTSITNINIPGNSPSVIPLTYQNGEQYLIKITNHCNSAACENMSDFPFYYNILNGETLVNGSRYELIHQDDRNLRAPCNILFSNDDLGG